MVEYTVIEKLIGQVVVEVNASDDKLTFQLESGARVTFRHYQDCCEGVYIEDIEGDLTDLLNTPLVVAEEATKENDQTSEWGMWTFYRFATERGWVVVRWYGESNGYYGVGVDQDWS